MNLVRLIRREMVWWWRRVRFGGVRGRGRGRGQGRGRRQGRGILCLDGVGIGDEDNHDKAEALVTLVSVFGYGSLSLLFGLASFTSLRVSDL